FGGQGCNRIGAPETGMATCAGFPAPTAAPDPQRPLCCRQAPCLKWAAPGGKAPRPRGAEGHSGVGEHPQQDDSSKSCGGSLRGKRAAISHSCTPAAAASAWTLGELVPVPVGHGDARMCGAFGCERTPHAAATKRAREQEREGTERRSTRSECEEAWRQPRRERALKPHCPLHGGPAAHV
ncbi:unnamed protein product, partial [Prorocentrum cordatum]